MLVKTGSADYATGWADPSSGGAIGGDATLSFGAAPGSTYTVETVTNAAISPASRIKVWVKGATADHNEIEHLIIASRIGLVAIPASGSFSIHAETELRLSGDIALKWEAA